MKTKLSTITGVKGDKMKFNEKQKRAIEQKLIERYFGNDDDYEMLYDDLNDDERSEVDLL